MKYGFIFIVVCFLLGGAYFSAQSKLAQPVAVESIRLGMTVKELENTFGAPSAQNRNQLTFILEDDSELFITLRDNLVSSAKVKFHLPIKIEDPQMRKMTLVQMEELNETSPSWFFAGKPEEGLIYKITSNGYIESLTWVPPFSYYNNRPKHLSAIFRDFHLSQM